jgi:hypothetical protein
MDWITRSNAALDWIRRSIDANHGNGSSAHLFFGKWSKPYPETTGYLIETLLDYSQYLNEPLWKEYALRCGQWLLKVQASDGSFPALYANSGRPSVFNTAMILFGLTRLWRETNDETYFSALQKAAAWLLAELAPDGSWPRHSYEEGYIPSYYTRAVWALLDANRDLHNPALEAAMRRALSFYAARIQENGFVAHWGFHPDKPAFTHTIAYTWRGLWEAGLLLGEENILSSVNKGLGRIAELRQQGGQLPGSISPAGEPDFSFSCLTGNAQLSLLASRIYRRAGEERLLTMARDFLDETARRQVLRPKSAYHGGIAGSHPLWGAYLRLRYPNWAVKFFLDAGLELVFVTRDREN